MFYSCIFCQLPTSNLCINWTWMVCIKWQPCFHKYDYIGEENYYIGSTHRTEPHRSKHMECNICTSLFLYVLYVPCHRLCVWMHVCVPAYPCGHITSMYVRVLHGAARLMFTKTVVADEAASLKKSPHAYSRAITFKRHLILHSHSHSSSQKLFIASSSCIHETKRKKKQKRN